MKGFLLVVVLLAPLLSIAQTSTSKNNTAVDTSRKASTEKTFKAGEYTMKQYFFVMLVKGARRNEITDTAVLKKLQEGHMKNIDRLAKMGKIIVAGPFGDDGNWRGIFIINAQSKEEVESLLKTDPAIAAGRLDYEIHPWWTAKNCLFN